MKTIIYTRQTSVHSEADVRLALELRGATVISTFSDDSTITGKGRYKGWNAMIAALDDADVVLIPSVWNLPPKPLATLYRMLAVFQGRGVSLCLLEEGIDTSTSAGVLDLIALYRRVQTSLRIKKGQALARKLGKRVGRPAVPGQVRQRIWADLLGGLGVRATGRKHGVSAATVVSIRKAMMASPETLAA